ncbi:glycerol kinase GlpK [Pelagibaculum spongiae]|uniref:Glycerol kinase n=1 Tax=Pelagibaculum spongiae TaxID=2080658 RepID=A0A2V1GNP7_9GAMM|nr:glycerol kinase GlpK [Pelagibaculum spongiae]PVZ63473.1 glycerol kinase [Pelagibaculum spongiae]
MYILSIDQGTTSTRAVLFDKQGLPAGVAQQEFTQYFPADGYVEHDAEEIWATTVTVCKKVMAEKGISASDIAAIGITNQRETTVVWDAETGKPIHHAIVWQDRRTAPLCKELQAAGKADMVSDKTGLLLDAYFSATKIAWQLDNVEGARELAEAGKLRFGTVDTFLLWRLTGGKSHKTDATNASRTNLFNIHTQEWDQELLDLFRVPACMLPQVEDCSADFGVTDPELFGGEIAITGIAGDQQAALFGQTCFEEGEIKSTYGTGCFMILNTGDKPLKSKNKMLTTVGFRLDGKTTYALEGSIFNAGTTIQWLRDGLRLFPDAVVTESLANKVGDNPGVYLVPAFTGLGAPYWDPNARGGIFGLTRDTGIKELVTAGLQSVCYQTKDLMEAMAADGVRPKALRVDGGMVVNNWVCQNMSDVLGITIDRPVVTETTALGVAYLAGLRVGFFESLDALKQHWQSDRRFEAKWDDEKRSTHYAGWLDAVDRVRTDK